MSPDHTTTADQPADANEAPPSTSTAAEIPARTLGPPDETLASLAPSASEVPSGKLGPPPEPAPPPCYARLADEAAARDIDPWHALEDRIKAGGAIYTLVPDGLYRWYRAPQRWLDGDAWVVSPGAMIPLHGAVVVPARDLNEFARLRPGDPRLVDWVIRSGDIVRVAPAIPITLESLYVEMPRGDRAPGRACPPPIQVDLEKEAYTVPEVATMFRVSERTIARWITSEELETVKIGGRRLIPRIAVSTRLRQARGS
jgi:excisionase family DNA binding protein